MSPTSRWDVKSINTDFYTSHHTFIPSFFFFVALLAILIVFWTRLAKLHQRTTYWVKPQLKFLGNPSSTYLFFVLLLSLFIVVLFIVFGIMLSLFALHPTASKSVFFCMFAPAPPLYFCLHSVWMLIVFKNNEHGGCEQNLHARAWLMPTLGTGSLGHCRLHAKSLPTSSGRTLGCYAALSFADLHPFNANAIGEVNPVPIFLWSSGLSRCSLTPWMYKSGSLLQKYFFKLRIARTLARF